MPGFEEFAAARWPSLVRAAWLLTGDWYRAEDIAQSALLSTWRYWARVSGADDPDRYVRRTLVNEFLRSRRRWWRGEPLPDRDEATPGDASSDVVARAEVVHLLKRLPPRQRSVVVLRYYLDMPEADAADVLGCSIGTVKSQASRALATLRDIAEDDGRLAGRHS